MELAIETKVTHYLDWLTYSYTSQKGKVGLGEFIANKLGRTGRIELLEAGNDTNYTADCSEIDNNKYSVEERAELMARMKKDGMLNATLCRRYWKFV
jgi:hypothetical protein